jgi:hypothetical protein
MDEQVVWLAQAAEEAEAVAEAQLRPGRPQGPGLPARKELQAATWQWP